MIEFVDHARKISVIVGVERPKHCYNLAWVVSVSRTDTQEPIYTGTFWHKANALRAIETELSASLEIMMTEAALLDKSKKGNQ